MSVYNLLYDWQKSIVDKFAKRTAFGYFLDMGLGKTPIAIASAEYVQATKVIIISINSKAVEKPTLKGSWLYWASKSNINYYLHNKSADVNDFDINKNEVLLLNYESLFSRESTRGIKLSNILKAFIKSCKNHKVALILDESHRVKNLSSKTTKSVNRLKKELSIISASLHTYLLSGTPFTQGYIDLYSQLKLLGYPSTKSHFVEQYCVKGRIPGLLEWQQPIVGYKNIQMLYRTLHKFSITIKSSDVIDLPEQVHIDHEIKKSEVFNLLTLEKVKQNYLLRTLERLDLLTDDFVLDGKKDKLVNNHFYRNLSYPSTEWFAETVGVYWMRARQASIGFQGNSDNYRWFTTHRLNALKKLIKEVPENYICFYNYTPELYKLYEVFEKEGYSIDIYSGEIKSTYFYEQFEEMSEDEQFNSKKRVIIANYASGSTGKNWQEYNHVIQFSIPLFGHHAQAIKRVHRIGQNNTVFYHRFYENNWLDKGMLEALSEQIEYDTKMFESEKRISEMEFNK